MNTILDCVVFAATLTVPEQADLCHICDLFISAIPAIPPRPLTELGPSHLSDLSHLWPVHAGCFWACIRDKKYVGISSIVPVMAIAAYRETFFCFLISYGLLLTT